MGRTVKTTATTKAVITNRVPTTLTTVYTNNTGRGAELRSVNINGTGDSTNFVTSTGGSDWTYFGSNVNPLIQPGGRTGTGFGIPYNVQLSDNRVLILFLPHFQHQGGDGADFMNGNILHAQILEYQGNRYVAGPITNLLLPDAPYSDQTYSLSSMPDGGAGSSAGSFGSSHFRAKALTPTKVVFGYRIRNNFRICRINIIGNTVTPGAVESLNLTGPTFFNTTNNQHWDIDTVPGNTNKVVIAGWAPTNWSVQAYNIPDAGTLSAGGALTSTGIPNSTHRISISKMVRTPTANVTPYIIAAATSATAGSAIIFNYNSATDAWSAASIAASLPTASSEWSGIQCHTLSTGTGASAVIATMSTGNPGVMTFNRQINATLVNTATTTLSLQHSSNVRSIMESYSWGNERAVFMGDGGTLVTYDSAGTAVNLLPATETTQTIRYQQQWFPFNSRPLYNLDDRNSIQADRAPQYVARVNMTSATNTGISEVRGNYLPFGHDYGIGYAWNEAASCWIVGQNGRIYALDTAGVIQSEVSLLELAPPGTSGAMTWQWCMKALSCGPSGRIYCAADFGAGVQSDNYACHITWDNYSGQNRVFVIEAISAPTDLNRAFLVAAPQNIGSFMTIQMHTVIEANAARTERAVHWALVTESSPQGYISEWNGTTWGLQVSSAISQASGGSGWMRGHRPNFRIIQDTPSSVANPRGLWRIIGSAAMNSSANYRQRGISNPFSFPNFGSANTLTNVLDSTQSTLGYGVTTSSYTSGNRSSATGVTSQIMVVAMYDETRGTIRVFASVNQRMQFPRGWQPNFAATTFPIDNTKRFPKCTATKFGYSVVFQNTATATGTAIAYVWDNINLVTPRFTLTSGTGHGQLTSFQTGKVSWQHFGESVDTTYSVGGIPDQVRFFIVLDDNLGNSFALNNGQLLDVTSSSAGLFRSEDVYVIPAGQSIRVRADTPLAITTLLSINENA